MKILANSAVIRAIVNRAKTSTNDEQFLTKITSYWVNNEFTDWQIYLLEAAKKLGCDRIANVGKEIFEINESTLLGEGY